MTNNELLVSLLRERNLTLSTAESFTAGLCASEICSVPGASQVFKGGVVCYNPEVKENLLSLNKELIEMFGVVSEPVAASLAENVAFLLNSDIALSFTGNAGPSVEEGKAIVGETFMAIYFKNKFLRTYRVIFKGDRNEIRKEAVSYLIEKLINLMPNK